MINYSFFFANLLHSAAAAPCCFWCLFIFSALDVCSKKKKQDAIDGVCLMYSLQKLIVVRLDDNYSPLNHPLE